MNHALVVFVAVLLSLGDLPAQAQTAPAKPTCAGGDPVVWENTSSKAYHLSGDPYYGKTKHGAYACKSAADTAGYHVAGAKGRATPTAADSPVPMPRSTPATMHHHHHYSGAAASPTPSPAAT